MGEYTIENGLVKITFSEDFVNNNATGNKITDGYVTWSATVSKSSTTTEETREISFTGNHKITFNFYQMSKSGKLSDDGLYATWTVKVNGNHAELKDYTLSDKIYHYYAGDTNKDQAWPMNLVDYLYDPSNPNATFTEVKVTMKNLTTGSSEVVTLPYTFGETTDEYELTYCTRVNPSMGISKIKNEVTLTKGNQSFTESAEVTPLAATTISKTDTAYYFSKDNTIAYFKWTITLYTGGYGVKGGEDSIPLKDVLSNDVVYTKAQLEATEKAFQQALKDAGIPNYNYKFYVLQGTDKLSVDELDEDKTYTNFRIQFIDDLPANITLKFTYESQMDLSGKMKTWISGKNTLALEGEEGTPVERVIKNPHSFGIAKNDKLYTGSSSTWDTTHDYYDSVLTAKEDEAGGLIAAGTKRVVWSMYATIPDSYQNTEEDLILTEILPTNLSYEDVVLGIRQRYGDGKSFTYTTVSTEAKELVLDSSNAGDLTIENSTVTVQVDPANKRKIIITVPKELAYVGYQNGGQGFSLELYGKIDAPTYESNYQGNHYMDSYYNEFVMQIAPGSSINVGQRTSITNIYPDRNDPIQKGVSSQDDNNLRYYITINPNRLNLTEGSDQVTVEDVLKYTLEDGQLFDLGLLEYNGTTVEIYKVEDSDGDGEDDTRTLLSDEEYTFVYQTKEENGTYYRTMSFLLEDETKYQLEYVYHGSGITGISASISNHVTLNGSTSESYEDSVETKMTLQASSAGASTDLNVIRLHKTDYDQQFTGLKGVEFDLYRVGSSTALKHITTGTDGYVELMKTSEVGVFAYNTLYYLVETKGLDGYETDTTRHYFYIKGEGDAPDFEAAGLTEDQVQVVLKGGSVQITNKKYVDLTIKKVDAEDSSVSAEALQGAKFSLYTLGNTSEDTDDKQVGTQQTTDENAKAVFSDLSRDVIYKLVEDEAPKGYQKAEEPYYFYIASGDASVEIDDSKVPDAYKKSVHVVSTLDHSMEFENTKTVKIELVKVNAKNTDTKLQGATFELWKVDTTTSTTIPNTDRKGTKVANGVTDEAGALSFDTDGDGEYYLVETAAPNGYIKLTESIEVNIKNGEISLGNETANTTYTLASGNSGARNTNTSKSVASWSFCINPTSKRPDGTPGYTLLENVDFSQFLSHVDDKDLTQIDGEFTADEYLKIQRLLYWYLTEKDTYVETARTKYNLAKSTVETNVYENVQRMIWEIIRNGEYKPYVNSSNDLTNLWTLLYGNGSTTGLINTTLYDDAIKNSAIFDIFVRPESSYQNMITIRTSATSASVTDSKIQVGNTPEPGTPDTTTFDLSLTKIWEGVDEDKLPDEITLTLEQVVDDQVIGTTEIVVTKKNNWKYTSSSFTATDNNGKTITYRVKEAGENGGKVSFGNNLYQVTYESEATSTGVSLTVTNKLIQNINQPETGANTRWITMIGGMFLLLLAAGYFLLRKSRIQ